MYRMSIVTLKKKTANKYNNLSVGQTRFSLNGSHRSQGFVGQTMLSRSLPRTLMKGNVARGYGGLNGSYASGSIIRQGTGLGNNCLNDVRYVKSSVLDTNGMIMSKYRWIRRPAPYTSVKPDANLHLQDQGQYIDILQRLTISEQCSTAPTSKDKKNCECSLTRPSYTNIGLDSSKRVVSKPDKVMTQGMYLLRLDNKCSLMDSGAALKAVLNKTLGSTPIACSSYVLKTSATSAHVTTVSAPRDIVVEPVVVSSWEAGYSGNVIDTMVVTIP
jgi:hypothetical protein